LTKKYLKTYEFYRYPATISSPILSTKQRVSVELPPESTRKLAEAILAALEAAEADGWFF
jgi:hypothetical protein